MRHKGRILKNVPCSLLVLALFLTGGCAWSQDTGNLADTEKKTGNEGVSDGEDGSSEYKSGKQADNEEMKQIAELYRDIYLEAEKEESLDSLDTMKAIIERLGKAGYTAVDEHNKINMVNWEKMDEFCRGAQENSEERQEDSEKTGKIPEQKTGEKLAQTILCVLNNGGFVRYDFEAENGELSVNLSTLVWKEGAAPEVIYSQEYTAWTWSYSEKGYLFFEEYHPSGYDGASGHMAFRVKPLDEKLRELTRTYLEPIGYGLSNLFLVEWDEKDYGNLEFCDIYEGLYKLYYGKAAEYDFTDETSYELPADEFEGVMTAYFNIDIQTLRQKTVYHKESDSYEYIPRGLYTTGLPYVPVPEAVSCRENADGTITLTADAVWAEENTDKALTHEVTVRPLSAGGFQYVSNHVVSWAEGTEMIWYEGR